MSYKERVKAVRVFGLDVDGVLTDGTFLAAGGKQYRRFHLHDGLGLILLSLAGIKTVLITGKKADRDLKARARELKIDAIYDECADKVGAMASYLKKVSAAWSAAGYMGDDLPDLPLLRKVAFACAPSDGVSEVRRAAHLVCRLPGGRGAVREAAEYILKESGQWTYALEKYWESFGGRPRSSRR